MENDAGFDRLSLTICFHFKPLGPASRWPGDPRVNIQKGKDGKAKVYQVRQVLAAIRKLEEQDNG